MTWWPVTTHKNLWKNHPSPRSQLELAKGPIFFRILGPFLNGAAEQLRERWADSNTMGSKWAWLRLAGKITITQTWLFVGTIYSPKHTKMIRFLFFSTQKMDQFIEWTKLQILWNSSAMIQACQSLVDGSSGFDIVYSRYICNVYIYHYCILYICMQYILQPASQRYYLFLDISRHCHALAASTTNIMIHYVHCQAISTMAARPWGTTRWDLNLLKLETCWVGCLNAAHLLEYIIVYASILMYQQKHGYTCKSTFSTTTSRNTVEIHENLPPKIR